MDTPPASSSVIALSCHGALFGAAGIGAGIAFVDVGIARLLRDHLIGAAGLGGGMAVVGLGIATLRGSGAIAGARIWLAGLTKEPDQQTAPGTCRVTASRPAGPTYS